MDTVLSIDKLSKIYKNGRGVRSISFSVEAGDVVGLLGPNGSGKTTILKTILGFCHPTEGDIQILGSDAFQNPEVALNRVGALIERPALFEHMTARDQLEMVARYHPDVDEKRIDEVLELVHMRQYQKDKCKQFSLGMKQRMGIAIALLPHPEVMILDEPTNGLDIEGMVEIRELILYLAKEQDVTFLIASHLAPELEKTCNKIAVVHEGELLAFETLEETLRFNPSLEEYFLSKVREKRGSLLT